MDQLRRTNANITETELLQNLFISQTFYAANTSIVRRPDAGPTRAREILHFAIPTAHAILGPFSPEILRALGFTSARAFGAIVYTLIDRGVIRPEPGDSITDFVSDEFDLFVKAPAAP